MEKIIITAALPYANGPLHFGHIAGAYLPADCYARFCRLMKKEVLFVCGSDEYGIAITISADIAKRTPKEHVDIFHKINLDFFNKLKISFDNYFRTTWEGHKPIVQEFFLELYKKGFIEEKIEDHLYLEEEDKFLADRYVIGTCPKCKYEKARGDECPNCGASYEAIDLIDPRAKLSGKKLVLKPSKHWYLRFDKFKEELADWIKNKKWKKNVLAMAKEYIKELRPRAITRDSKWGVPLPLPDSEGKVLYVWFDAPIGYISSTEQYAIKIGEEDLVERFWLDPNTKLVQFIGKDNIPFHAVFFPAMLMGQTKKYVLPSDIPANEFLLFEGKQFSKSDNWYIDLEEFFKNYSVDQIRYYLAANAPETSDAEFTWKDFQLRCNSELLSKFGNFINRVFVFTQNKLSSTVPDKKDLDETDLSFLETIKTKVNEAKNAFDTYHLRRATQVMMELAQEGNIYFDSKKPWVLAKDPKDLKKLKNTIYVSLEAIKALSLISYPIIPDSAEKIWKTLGFENALIESSFDEIINLPFSKNQKILKPEILFRKIEDAEITKELSKLKK